MSLLLGAITIGLILALLAMGIFVSFKIFNFADITAEGSITLGASIAAALIVSGVNPLLSTLIAMAGGFLAGAATGVIHTKFKINGLLSGILVMTALYSINLHIMGKSNLPLMSSKTLFSLIESINPISNDSLWIMLTLMVLVIVVGILLFIFFGTNLGTSMRATGNNQQMIRALGVNTSNMMILGLAISNSLIAMSGAILAQFQGFADVQMGIGMLVWGLASVIIGEALIGGEKSYGTLIVGAVLGSVIFRLLVAVALRWGMNPNDLKLVTAIFVFIALILPGILKKYKNRRVNNAAN